MSIVELTGMSFNPNSDRWRLSKNFSANYVAVAGKPEGHTANDDRCVMTSFFRNQAQKVP